MNNTPKISLSIYRQGSALIRQSEAEQINWKITKGDLLPEIPDLSEKDKLIIVDSGVTNHYNRIPKQVLHLVKFTQDAYNEFIEGTCPNWADSKDWFKMNKWARINAHCKVIAAEYGSKNYEFTILED